MSFRQTPSYGKKQQLLRQVLLVFCGKHIFISKNKTLSLADMIQQNQEFMTSFSLYLNESLLDVFSK